MKKIKRTIAALYLNELSRSEKVTQGTAILEAIPDSPHFNPAETAPLLATLQTATDNLNDADAETASGSHESFALAESAELQYDTAVRNTAYYVQTKADANPAIAEEIILSAAMKTKKASVKMKPPHPVQDVRAKVTGDGNSIKLYVVSDNPRSTRFEVLMSTTPDIESSWVSIANTTARRLLVENLVNGTRYYFKVKANNNIGTSIYSNVISQIAA